MTEIRKKIKELINAHRLKAHRKQLWKTVLEIHNQV